MRQTWTYRWAAGFFGTVLVICVGALPFAIRCCSQLSAEQIAFQKSGHWDPSLTRFSLALLNWPRGFSLLLMTITAAICCLASVAALFLVARATRLPGAAREKVALRAARIVARGLVVTFMTGVLFILLVWVLGFFGADFPLPAFGMFLIVLSVGLMEDPRPRGLLLVPLLLLSGLIGMTIVAYLAGIPLD